MPLSRRQLNLAGFAVCAALLGFALFVQHGLGVAPCNMCILQRIAVGALGLALLAAAVHDPADGGARLYGALIALTGLVGAALSARHVWMQMQPAGSLPSCGADFYTLLGMLPPWEVVTKILRGGGDCQAIGWSLFGISMPGWLLLAVTVISLAGVVANFSPTGVPAAARSRRAAG